MMMTVEDYRESFIKDGTLVNVDGFLKTFALEFLNKVNTISKYQEFNKLVYDMMVKYRVIRGDDIVSESYEELRKPLKDKVWNTFFAIYVVPIRKEKFPKQQKNIEKRRAKNMSY